MAFICFVGTYNNLRDSRLHFITGASLAGKWEVLSFDLEKCGASLSTARETTGRV